MGFTEVKHSRDNIELKALSPSLKQQTVTIVSQSPVFAKSKDIGHNQQIKESQEVIMVDDKDRREICQNKIEENACKYGEENAQI